MIFESQGWTETHDGKPQCTFTDENGNTFIIRMMSEHNWASIAIRMPKYMVGQIIAEGQSDTDCYYKTMQEIGGD